MGANKDTITALAARAQGVTNSEVATAIGTTSENAGGALSVGINSGWLFKSKRQGDLTHYFTTQKAATDWKVGELPAGTILDKIAHGVIAKAAVKSFKAGDIRTSFELADRCSCSVEFVDQALAPLVDLGKLIRVPTQRSGLNMFSYRYSSVWVPREEDFNYRVGEQAPKASVSPVAPPKAKALSTAPAQRAKTPVAAPKPAAPTPHQTNRPADPGTVWPGTPTNKSLGFEFAEQLLAGTGSAPLEALVDGTGSSLIEASDLAFAINSLGEFVIDLGQGDLVMFTPQKALQLKRFLGNTTILESLEGAA